ncbi:MAG: VanZ family protein [Cyanobacteria bacterium P01_D01_bin.1]
MLQRSQTWNRFVLAYLILSAVLLTLYPFQFQPYDPAEYWRWKVSLPDLVRNFLLLFPVGLVLRHAFRKSHALSLFCGFLLSLSVEMAQMFLPVRSSNIIDITSNSVGALFGSLFHQWAFAGSLPSSISIPFAFMLVPLCWVIALRAAVDPAASLAIVPCAIAGFILLHVVVLECQFSAKGLFNWLKRNSILAIWSFIVFLPLVSVFHFIGFILLVAVPLTFNSLRPLSRQTRNHWIPVALFIGFVTMAVVNAFWYFTTESPIWKPDDPFWNLRPSLRLIEIFLSSAVLLSSRPLTNLLPNFGSGDQPIR